MVCLRSVASMASTCLADRALCRIVPMYGRTVHLGWWVGTTIARDFWSVLAELQSLRSTLVASSLSIHSMQNFENGARAMSPAFSAAHLEVRDVPPPNGITPAGGGHEVRLGVGVAGTSAMWMTSARQGSNAGAGPHTSHEG